MNMESWIGLGLQTVIILAGIIALHMRTRDRITTLEVNHVAIDRAVTAQRKDHNRLGERVSGISRQLERVCGKVE